MDKIPMSSIPQLTSTNYYVWAMKLEAVLGLKKVRHILTTNRPANETNREKWDGDNDDVVSIIKLTLSDDQAMQFADQTNAKELWSKIKETYVGRLEDSKINATVELRSITMNDKETTTDYVARARGIASKCKSLNVNISDRELVYYVVRGLNGKFNRIRSTLKTQREKKLDDVLEDLREEEREQNNQKKRSDAAYATREGKTSVGKKCFVCKKPGHPAKVCWYRKSNEKDGEKKDRQERWRGNQRSDTQHQGCSQRNRQEGRNDRSEKANEATDDYAYEANDEDRANDGYIVSWILDSGCSSHMIKEKFVLNDFNHMNGNVFLAGKGNVTKSEGIGSVNSKFEIDNKYGSNIYLKDTLYVPELRNNLLSIRKLDEMGYKVVFGNDLALIYDSNKTLIGKGIKNGPKYVIESEITIDVCFMSIENMENMSKEMLWHKRLAHLSPKYIDRLIKESLVKNAHKISKGEIECESCSASKLTQKPHRIVEYKVTSKPLELIYIDLCGPMPTNSIKGSKYIMVIVDDYSGMYFVYFLKHKSEALNYFIEFQKKFENRLETTIKSIRSDNGREFINENFCKHLNESGVSHQKTVPFNPQSNGKVERANRVLLDRARTMLYDSKLPQKFWAEAVATACHVSNLTPRKGKGNTPFELFYGYKPSLKHLKVFGCVAFFYVPKQHRDKLEPRGEIGIMVGYARGRSGYRIYDIKNQRVTEERTVKFHENAMGSALPNTKEISNGQLKIFNVESLFKESDEELLEKREDNVDAGSDNDSDVTDNVIDPPRNLNANEKRKGRPEGTTKAVMQTRLSEQQRDREAKLLEQGVRRSNRITSTNNNNVFRRDNHDFEANETDNEVVPNNFKEAKESKEWIKWHNAMKDEISSLNSHDVWKIVEKIPGVKTVKSKWIYSIKNNPENKTRRYKARLVAAGFNQIKYRDYEESYSPVVTIEAWRLLLSIAAKQDMRVRFYDVETAYLYGSINETVYMMAPPGFEKMTGPDKVCKLQKSIYGLPQSGRNWFKRLRKELLNLGLKQLASDNCIFMYNKENVFVCVSVYVDDLSIIDNNAKAGDRLVENIRKTFKLNETTSKGIFLGMEIKESEKEITISQEGYIKTLLEKHGMLYCKPVGTPIVSGHDKEPDSPDDIVESKEYQEIIGELLYLSNRSRPDITFATNYLSQFNIRPEKRHYIMAKRILRYLSGTLNYKLSYNREQGKLNGSSDASWGNGVKMKSYSGGVIQLGRSLIMWNCRKQKCVADSTCEAELFAINDVTKNVKWLIGLLSELGFENFCKLPVSIASDSQSAIDVLKDARSSRRLRHVLLKSQYVKDEVTEGRVCIAYVNTDSMKADFLTKAVTKEKLVWSCEQLNLY